jgi:hypothetical protein
MLLAPFSKIKVPTIKISITKRINPALLPPNRERRRTLVSNSIRRNRRAGFRRLRVLGVVRELEALKPLSKGLTFEGEVRGWERVVERRATPTPAVTRVKKEKGLLKLPSQ